MKWYLLFITILPTITLASGAPAPEVLRDNADLFQWILGGALLMNGVFIMRQLKSLDRLWERTDGQESRLSTLEGEHKVQHRRE